MARPQVDQDERKATGTQHATELASANQANATMDTKMQNLLAQVQALQLANTPTNGSNYGRGRSHRHAAGRGHGRARLSAPPTPK